jgi:hypothetical protein
MTDDEFDVVWNGHRELISGYNGPSVWDATVRKVWQIERGRRQNADWRDDSAPSGSRSPSTASGTTDAAGLTSWRGESTPPSSGGTVSRGISERGSRRSMLGLNRTQLSRWLSGRREE